MEDMGACSTQFLLRELELSREPPESISARSLGQAAEVLSTPRKTRISSPRFSPEFVYRSARGSSSMYVDAIGSLGTTSPEPTTGDGQHVSLGRQDSSINDKNAALTAPSPSQRQESAEVAEVESQLWGAPRDNASSSALREHDAAQCRTPPRPANPFHPPSVPISTHHERPQALEVQVPSNRDPINASPHSPNRSPPGDRQLQQIQATLSEEFPLAVNQDQDVEQREETSQSVGTQPHIPGELPTHDEFLPQWVKTTSAFLLSLAKRILLHFIPLLPSTLWSFVKSTAFLLLSLAHVFFVIAIPKICVTLRDGLIRGYTWCTRRRPTPIPTRPISEGPTPGPRDSEPTTPNIPHVLPRSRCSHCLSDFASHTIIHCPRGHAACVDCLSSHTTRQVAYLADGSSAEVVCLHPSGCRQPFEVGVLSKLFDLVHNASISGVQPSVPGRREVEVKVKVEENEDREFMLSDESDVSARIEDAISRCNVSLRMHRAIESEPTEAYTSAHVYRDHADSNSDVEDYSQSVSAWGGLGQSRGEGSATPGPSTPTQQRLQTPVQLVPRVRREFFTAPPPDSPRRPESLGRQRAASAVPQKAKVPENQTLKSLKYDLGEARRIKKNTQKRLKMAEDAHASRPTVVTEAKLELETRLYQEHEEAVLQAEEDVKVYESGLWP
ncbi:hypothetical protein FA13DRAFT_1739338 [Coprinellus micaceus]|uniref:Uncharacterized protein n=1 Tax=Coprinellus micaceus TaxID=71717 RepID=A0A4Y7SR11_COPMI|nr:hypothetical protein FA13DRAFT_1739338 [Coprinellus micaceus]